MSAPERGVPLTYDPRPFSDASTWHKPYRIEEATHRAFLEPVAAALVDVAEAALAVKHSRISVFHSTEDACDRLAVALDRLDAARGAS